MSVSYVIAPITGDGTGENPYRPDMPGDVGYVALVSSNPDGTPRKAWVLCLIDGAPPAGVFVLPLTPDTPMSSVPQNQRNQYTTRLRQNGYDITIDWATDTAADVVDRLMQVDEPTATRGSMSVGSGRWGGA